MTTLPVVVRHKTKTEPTVFCPHPLVSTKDREIVYDELFLGESLGEYLDRVGIGPKIRNRPTLVTINGARIPRELWYRCWPKPGALIRVQAIVYGGGGGKKVGRTILTIIVLIASYYTGGAVGAAYGSGYGVAAAAAVAVIGGLAVNAIFPLPSPDMLNDASLQDTTSPTFDIAGGSNRARLFEPLPVVMGVHRFFPDYGAKPYTEFRGEDQVLFQIFDCGYNDLDLSDLKLGDTPISSYTGVEIQISGSDGALTLFPTNVDTVAGGAITSVIGFVMRTSSIDSTSLAIEITGGLFAINSVGVVQNQVDIEIQYRLVGTGTWISLVFASDSTPANPPVDGVARIPAAEYNAGVRRTATNQPVNITGVTVLHASGDCPTGTGTLTYTFIQGTPGSGEDNDEPDNKFLSWTPPGGIAGPNVDVSQFLGANPRLYTLPGPSNDKTLSVRIIGSSLPNASKVDSIGIGAPLGAGLITIFNASRAPLRRTYLWNIAKGQYEVQIRKVTVDSTDTTLVADMVWSQLRSYQPDDTVYIGRKRVALRITASGQLSGVIDSFNCIASARAPTYAGSQWITTQTSNPAWWVLQAVRARRAGQVNYLSLPGTSGNFASTPDSPGTGFSLVFDGVDDFAIVPANAGLDTPTAFAIEAWINDLNDGVNWHSINRDDETPSTKRIWIVRRDTDTVGNYHVWNSASVLRQFTPANSWKINEWFHLIFTCWVVGGTINLEVFINGVSVGTDSFAGTAIRTDPLLPIRFSRRPITNDFKKQILDRARYYSRRIEAVEAAEHYNGVFSDDTGLVGRWDFNEGTGTVANDSSGNGNHAVLTGDPVWRASLDITGDIEFIGYASFTDMTPAGNISVVSKSDSTTNRAYGVMLTVTTGRIQLWFSTTGSDFLSVQSSVAPPYADGVGFWFKCNRNATTGAGNFYTSSDPAGTHPNNVTWTQLGTADVAGTAGAIFSNTSPLRIGTRFTGFIESMDGRVYRLQVKNGINGMVVADFDASKANVGDGLVEGGAGEIWTINRSGSPAANIVSTGARRAWGGVIPDTRIDLENIKAFGAWCDAQGLTFDGVFDQQMSVYDMISAIAFMGRGAITYGSGKLSVVWDAPSTAATAIFSMSNIVRDSFEITYLTENLADEIAVTFINPDINWQQDSVRVLAAGVTDPIRSRTVSLFGCTSKTLAAAIANLLMAANVFRARRYTWHMDWEGMPVSRGDVGYFTHELASSDYSGRLIEGSTASVLKLERKVPLSPAGSYVTVVKPDGSFDTYTVQAGMGDTSSLTLVGGSLPFNPGADPNHLPYDYKWLYSLASTPSKKVKIESIKPVTFKEIEVTAVDEDPAYYAAASGVFQHVTPKVFEAQLPILTNLQTTEVLVANGDTFVVKLTISWDVTGVYDHANVAMGIDGGTVRPLGTATGTRFEVTIPDTGTVQVEVIGVHPLFGSGPNSKLIGIHVIAGKNAPPSDVTGLSLTFEAVSTVLRWSKVPDVDVEDYGVRIGAIWESAIGMGRTKGGFMKLPAFAAVTTLLVKANDTSGNSSINAASIVATPILPSTVSVIAAFDGGDVVLTWPVPVAGSYQILRYEVRYGTTWASGTLAGIVDVTTFRTRANWVGSRTWWVAARDAADAVGPANSVEAVVVKPSAPVISAEIIDNNVLLQWSDSTQTLPIRHYEVRRGSVFATATVVGTVQARFSTIFESSSGSYRYWIVGVDSADNYGTESSFLAAVSQPPDFVLYDTSLSQLDSTNRSNWLKTEGTNYALDLDGSTQYGQVASIPDLDSGITGLTFETWFATDSIASNQLLIQKQVGGADNTCALLLIESSQVKMRVDVGGVDFNAVASLSGYVAGQWIHAVGRWDGTNVKIALQGANVASTAAAGSLSQGAGVLKVGQLAGGGYPFNGKIALCRVYKRAIDDTELAEHYHGIFKTETNLVAAWGMDEGTGTTAFDDTDNAFDLALVNTPPWVQTLLDGRYDATLGAPKVYLPVKSEESVTEYATRTGYTTPQAATDAGSLHPVTPGMTTGQYIEVIDFGVVIPSTNVRLVLADTAFLGSVTITPTISVRELAADPWTDFVGVFSVFTTNFRYVKITLNISAAGGNHIRTLTQLLTRLDVKLISDAGEVNCISTDSGGTTVTFNVAFLDVQSITVTPKSTAARIGVYDFVDVPNPTTFKALLFDTGGNRVSGLASWSAKGV